MKRYENPLIFPLESNKTENYIAAAVSFGICAYLVFSVPEFFFSKQWFTAACFWLILLLLLLIGLIMPLAKVNMSGKEIIVSSMGIKLRRVPRERVCLLCTGTRHTRHRHKKYIGICFGTASGNIVLSEHFLIKQLQKQHFFHLGHHVVWVEYAQQRELVLKGMFPDTPWTEIDFNDSWR